MKRKKGRVNLMRIQINLCTRNRARQLFKTVKGTALRQFIGEVFRMVIRDHSHSQVELGHDSNRH